jgi:hypothetical protein
MSKLTAVEWLEEQIKKDHPFWIDIFEQAKAMERKQIEENMAKAIPFGWDLSQYHRHNTEEKLLQMQKDFITSVIEGGEQ